MPKNTKDEIQTTKHRRLFVQWGGPVPGNKVLLAGLGTGYAIVGDATTPVSGGIKAINVHDPLKPGDFRRVANSKTPADFPTVDLTLLEKTGKSIPKQIRSQVCPLNLYENVGVCSNIGDAVKGWSDFVRIYSYAEATSRKRSGQGWEDDKQTEDTLALVLQDIYDAGTLDFDDGYIASGSGGLGVIATAFDCRVGCNDCGNGVNDGTKRIYAVSQGVSGSGSILPQLFYSLDGGLTWTATSIGGSPAIARATYGLAVINGVLVVLGQGATGGGFWYTPLSSTGAPTSWSVVQTGFTAGHQPWDMAVLSPNEIVVCGADGYVWKASNYADGVSLIDAGTVTTNVLNKIDGKGDVLVSVGGAGTVIISRDRGATWGLASASPVGTVLSAVAVLDDYRYWVGTTLAGVYYTLDGGASWTVKVCQGISAIVQDIMFPTDECGFVVGTNSFSATTDGGENWNNGMPRLNNRPTLGQVSCIGVPDCAKPDVKANFVVFGGLSVNNSDGLIYVAKASEF